MNVGPFSGLSFQGEWRRYQQLALDAFDRDRAAGHRKTYLIAPPGSGKTLVGIEAARRIGGPGVVLAPNSAVQAQWLAAADKFDAPAGFAAPEPGAPLACLTYQSLCQLDDPSAVLDGVVERRWAHERATATAQTIEEVEREAQTWTGEAAARRERELRRIAATVKREIARAEHGQLHLGHLLSDGARSRIAGLKESGVTTVVLDECHHLASLWGYAIRAAVEELSDVHVIGLTATPPDELTRDEAELYAGLLGEIDFTIPTPAVVREGHLAPFQELAWLTRPLDSEAEWLREHDARFRELVDALHGDAESPISFPVWVLTRMRERGRGGEDSEVSWSSFQRRHPALARAGARFLSSAGLELPRGVPRGEAYRAQPTMEDWIVLLEDYALRCLDPQPSPEAQRRRAAVADALRDLGWNLTRQGIRRAASDVDRLLTTSESKAIGLVEVIAAEANARADRLRALVLCDSEQATRRADDALVNVLRPDAATAPAAVLALSEDMRTAPLRPLLVSGRGIRCAPSDASALLAALRELAQGDLTDWRAEADENGLANLKARGPGWQPRAWVELATQAFMRGATQALVGTRALLGEGWDCPAVNCLVDMTAATTAVSVTQMRGRSLRLDPRDPEKIASNWDIVCAAADLTRGDADYGRFVRKHAHLYAPGEDGVIEAGPSHVHPALGPFEPPADDELTEINRSMITRASEFREARERWAIGSPYEGSEYATVIVRPRAKAVAERAHEEPAAYRVSQRAPLAAGVGSVAAGAVVAAGGAAAAGLVLGPLGVIASGAWAYRRLARTQAELTDAVPLDRAAYAIRDAYAALGELSAEAADSLAIEPRASGYLRVWLRRGSPEESERFSRALGEILLPEGFPRYVVSRLVPGRRAPIALLARAATFRPPFERRWEAVPSDLGTHKNRAEAFAAAWKRWLGPSSLLFTQRAEEGHAALAAAGAQASQWDVRPRQIWL